jgi:hypothetical protein
MRVFELHFDLLWNSNWGYTSYHADTIIGYTNDSAGKLCIRERRGNLDFVRFLLVSGSAGLLFALTKLATLDFPRGGGRNFLNEIK